MNNEKKKNLDNQKLFLGPLCLLITFTLILYHLN